MSVGLEPEHACSRCDPKFPPENDGCLPWLLDGEWRADCPHEVIPAWACEVLAAADDYEKGHTPVTQGRAPWLPGAYLECVGKARIELNRQRAKKRGD